MKNLGKISILLFILIFTLSFGQEVKKDSVQVIKSIGTTDSVLVKGKHTGSLKGIVSDDSGNPLGNAIVRIKGTSWSSKTDLHGTYYIQNVRKGSYFLTINYDYKTYEQPDIKVYPDSIFQHDITIKIPDDSKSDLPAIEGSVDFQEIKVSKDVTYKPIIYIYPEKETEVNVKLNYKGTFTSTYPKYPENGWTVTAKPDGTLKDKSGKEYYSLFWEGVTDKVFTLNEGFVVKRDDTAGFLEKSLRTLGLNFRETNEFIIYWLPELEKHPYDLIHFSTKEYEELAELSVNPVPDTVIRVFMVFKGLEKPAEIKPQTLVSKVRKGFTVVEWGGSEIKNEAKSVIR